ncbi:DUF4292 domain-containing protein [Ichthyenterobacterium sp. W332]|uniref:DUF4292 domain-containing protein n=1 Tax=Microcosmobacter mediterraneus TaxID=3075607 RepID=A0ABU2YJN7_9FLAO|nr:DUF4292 domain-containing protein [Ichthyenterobacterium sp. W332]MDT0558101.1 DUF4292 domain-containing protein [Ichthyenterobacterium sp. W332]
MKPKFLYFYLLVFIGLHSCKSAKSISSDGTLDASLSTKQLIKKHNKQDLDFKTLQAKVKIEYSEAGSDKSQSYNLSLRVQNGKTIWISATLGLARAIITPDKVQFYDKINNQFFDGNYALLSDILGVDLDYDKVQNLLLGQSIFKLSDKTYASSTYDKSYMVNPKEQNALFELFILLNPGHYKTDSLQIHQPQDRRFLQVDYPIYQDIEKQIVPQNIRIVAVENDDEVTIVLDYKSVTLNNDLRFPFKIPSGYKEIKL